MSVDQFENVCLGIDIGGSSAKVGVVTGTGELLEKKTISLTSLDSRESLGHELDALLDECGIAARAIKHVGIAVPANVDKGYPHPGPNLRMDFNAVREKLSQLYPDANVGLLNDANAAALGEGWVGAAKGVGSYILVTLGTGVGGGVVVDGKLLVGRHGGAGEIGHICVEVGGRPCNCGAKGCLERYASANGIIDSYREIAGQAKAAGKDAGAIFAACREGDEDAVRAVDIFGTYLGAGLASIVRSFDPDLILLGGGVSRSFDLFEDQMRATFATQVPSELYPTTIGKAILGNDAGIVGAAYFALNGQADGREDHRDRGVVSINRANI